MGKTNRSGQSATLSVEQLDALTAQLPPMELAAVSVCRYTACRITESLSLLWENVLSDSVVFPRHIVKKKTKTRCVPMSPKLLPILEQWRQQWTERYGKQPEKTDFVFPRCTDVAVRASRQWVDKKLREACARVGIQGASLHSLRRSALTLAHSRNVPIRVIQQISGHSSLEQLQRYLDCSDEQKRQAVMQGFG